MALFLSPEQERQLRTRPGSAELVIRAQPYRSTAAKFWSRLIDELALVHPACDRIVLTTPDDRALTAILLEPERELERDAARLRHADAPALLRNLVAEMTLFGPPQPVQVRLFKAERLLAETTLPRDGVDNSVFPYVLVWLLEWAQVPVSHWNNAVVDGEFQASDPVRQVGYAMQFQLRNRPVAEGLLERELTLTWRRTSMEHGARSG